MPNNKLIITKLLLFIFLIFSACAGEKEKLLSEADAKFIQEGFNDAERIYKSIIERYPTYKTPHLRLATLTLIQSKQYSIFSSEHYRLNNYDPKFYRIIRQRGGIKYSEIESSSQYKEYLEEIKFLDKVLDEKSSHPIFYYVRGCWHYLFNNHELAIDDFIAAVRIDRNFADASLMLGRTRKALVQKSHRFDKLSYLRYQFGILDYYINALNNSPRDRNILLETAYQLSEVGQRERAIELITEAYNLDTTFYWILEDRAAIKNLNGDLDGAIEDYRILYKRNTKNLQYLISEGTALLLKGDKKRGLEILGKAENLSKDEGQKNWLRSIIEKNL